MSKYRVKVVFEIEVSGAKDVEDAELTLCGAQLYLPSDYGTVHGKTGYHFRNGICAQRIGREIKAVDNDQHPQES